MIGNFDHLDQAAIQRGAGYCEARLLQWLPVLVIKLIAMSVTFDDLVSVVNLVRDRTGLELARLTTQSHCSTEIAVFIAALDSTGLILPFGDQTDDGVRRELVKLATLGVSQPGDITGKFDYRDLHSKAYTQIRNALFACVAYGHDLAFNATLSEAARHQHCIHTIEHIETRLLDNLGIHVLDSDPGVSLYPSVDQRF